MSFSNNKNDLLRIALENRIVDSLDYSTFENFVSISKGGFGKVKRAHARSLGKHVALKRLYENEEFHENFIREVSK